MTFAEVRDALITATVNKPAGSYVAANEIQQLVPNLTVADVVVELKTMEEFGEATVTKSWTRETVARFDGLIWRLPDGKYGTVVDQHRYVTKRLDEILADGFKLHRVDG